MTDMDFIISNHPYIPSMSRTVQLAGITIDTLNKMLKLNIIVHHYSDGVFIPEMDRVFDSVAVNSTLLPHPMGNGEIGEYDYWMLAYQMNLPLSKMLTDGIKNIDVSGSINRKCEYNIPTSLLTTSTTEYVEEITTSTTTEYVEDTTTTTTEYIEETTTTTEYVIEDTTTTTEYIEDTTTTTEYVAEETTTLYVDDTTITEYVEPPTPTAAPRKKFLGLF